MRMHRLTAGVMTGLVVGALVAGRAGVAPATASARTQAGEGPQIVFTALRLADHVRYVVTLPRPLAATVTNVGVEVTLPAGAELVEAVATPDRTVLLRADGGVLSWAAPGYEPGDPADAFTFRLARPLGAEAHVRATWELDGRPGMDELRAAPDVQVATAAAGEATVGARGDPEATPAGDTGVRLEVGPEAGLDGSTLRVSRPGPEANPPAGVGSPWWCAMLAVEGLPDGASVFAVVPARQPLPPGAWVELFAERGGGWERLDDRGRATADGQFVAFRHPGGTVAAGVSPALQPVGFPEGGVLQEAVQPPRLEVSILGPTQLGFSTSAVHSIRVSNVGTGPAASVFVNTQITYAPVPALLPPDAPFALPITSVFGISGGFDCRIVFNQRHFSLAHCASARLAAGASGTILVGTTARDRPVADPSAPPGTPVPGLRNDMTLKVEVLHRTPGFASAVQTTPVRIQVGPR